MKTILHVVLRDRIMFKGTSTTQLSTANGVKLTKVEDGIEAEWEERREGVPSLCSCWVPDANIVAVQNAPEALPPKEAKPTPGAKR